jgi:methionyl-tRNA formyltransferase
VAAVLTQPDRPAGRGMKVVASAVSVTAQRLGIPLLKPASLRGDAVTAQTLAGFDSDVMIVAAYGLILPAAVLEIPRLGCINIHASLLPRWRGAAPIQRAILAGDSVTGISIMQMDAGLDTGDVLLAEEVPITTEDTTATLTVALAAVGARLVVRALAQLPMLEPKPQDASRATYAAKVTKEEACIDWSQPAERIARQVRAFNPAPGAETVFEGQPLKIWRASPCKGSGRAGTVIQSGAGDWIVACGEGALRLDEVQKSGGRRVGAADFLRGARIQPGATLSSD